MKRLIIVGLFVAVVLMAGSSMIVSAQNMGAKATTWNSACIVTAVEKRENAIIAAQDSLSAAIKASLEKRKTALVAAWGISIAKDRRQARQTAWNTFRTEQKTARQTHLTAQKAAWSQFKIDAKACKIDVTGIEPEGLDVSVSAAAVNSASAQ